MLSPIILYPADGTFSISIRPLAPTNNISEAGSSCFKALAIAIAGKMCPPVPPPLMIILFPDSILDYTDYFFFDSTDYFSSGLSDFSDFRTYTATSLISPTITFFGSSISRLTDNMIPNAILVNNMDVPPILTNGSGIPVTGPKPTATAMLAKACIVKLKLNPAASNAPNAFGALVTILMHLYNRNR